MTQSEFFRMLDDVERWARMPLTEMRKYIGKSNIDSSRMDKASCIACMLKHNYEHVIQGGEVKP